MGALRKPRDHLQSGVPLMATISALISQKRGAGIGEGIQADSSNPPD